MKPITFDADSVRAIHAGTKTQFRVPLDTAQLTLRPGFDLARDGKDANRWKIVDGEARLMLDAFSVAVATIRLPFGGPGTRRWVQEKWRCACVGGVRIEYAAGGKLERHDWPEEAIECYRSGTTPADVRRHERIIAGEAVEEPWRSPTHMPRWASRLTLEIVSVRVERVQEIPFYEIRSEGLRCPEHDSPGGFCCSECDELRAAFAARWNRLYAKRGYPWESNPWVFAREFRTITPTAADAAGD